jgi:hypothetical protein
MAVGSNGLAQLYKCGASAAYSAFSPTYFKSDGTMSIYHDAADSSAIGADVYSKEGTAIMAISETNRSIDAYSYGNIAVRGEGGSVGTGGIGGAFLYKGENPVEIGTKDNLINSALFRVANSGAISNPFTSVLGVGKPVNIFDTQGLTIGNDNGVLIGLTINGNGSIDTNRGGISDGRSVEVSDAEGMSIKNNFSVGKILNVDGYIQNIGTGTGEEVQFRDDNGISIKPDAGGTASFAVDGLTGSITSSLFKVFKPTTFWRTTPPGPLALSGDYVTIDNATATSNCDNPATVAVETNWPCPVIISSATKGGLLTNYLTVVGDLIAGSAIINPYGPIKLGGDTMVTGALKVSDGQVEAPPGTWTPKIALQIDMNGTISNPGTANDGQVSITDPQGFMSIASSGNGIFGKSTGAGQGVNGQSVSGIGVEGTGVTGGSFHNSSSTITTNAATATDGLSTTGNIVTTGGNLIVNGKVTAGSYNLRNTQYPGLAGVDCTAANGTYVRNSANTGGTCVAIITY